jgi:hypothetical protein
MRAATRIDPGFPPQITEDSMLETAARPADATAAEAERKLTDGFHLVIDALKLNGLNTIYGVPGIPITDFGRLAQAAGMRVISFRHEQHAGNAAAIAGFLTKKPGVCLTVSAPGFLNGLTALANATTNCFPMILISGSSEREIIDLQVRDRPGRLHEVGAHPTRAGAVAAVQLHVAAGRVLLGAPVEQLGVKGRSPGEVRALEFYVDDRGAGHSQRPYQHVAKMAITATSYRMQQSTSMTTSPSSMAAP